MYVEELGYGDKSAAPPELNAAQQKTFDAVKEKGFEPVVANDRGVWWIFAGWDAHGRKNACSDADAKNAAAALDDNRMSAAANALKNCGFDATGRLVYPSNFQTFAEKVSNLEQQDIGRDLLLQYSVGSGEALQLTNIEIK